MLVSALILAIGGIVANALVMSRMNGDDDE
jgi:hypothetical protein